VVLLVDLDGTVLDPARGIVDCLAQTVKAFDGPRLGAASRRSRVGQPIADTLREHARLEEDRVADAVAYYRRLYLARGAFNSTVFPGVFALLAHLAMLRETRLTLTVATSKRESHAR